jgi:site-specific DNA-methyltransferase (cytosine-N4-specific)
MAHTGSNDFFHRECRRKGITPHPARMPAGLASFFLHFLTDPGDLVLDPFAGSNTTGYVAEMNRRRWIAIEQEKEFAQQSRIRFRDPVLRGKGERGRRTSR